MSNVLSDWYKITEYFSEQYEEIKLKARYPYELYEQAVNLQMRVEMGVISKWFNKLSNDDKIAILTIAHTSEILYWSIKPLLTAEQLSYLAIIA